MQPNRNDQILSVTRITAAIIVPVLLIAFVILFFFPHESARYFAFPVQPTLMAIYVGAGYVGGAWLFVRVLVGRRWHAVAAGFPAITTFTISMLGATLWHWGPFDLTHVPFLIWLGLYLVTPLFIPWLWLRNRVTDPGTLLPPDVQVPQRVRGIIGGLGLGLTIGALVWFVFPQWLIPWWAWTLSPFSARLTAGWIALIGVGTLVISRDPRWSAWRVGVESLGLWHLLFIIGAIPYRQEFRGGTFWNWYVVNVISLLLVTGACYGIMERRRRSIPRGVEA